MVKDKWRRIRNGKEMSRRVWSNNLLNVRHFIVIYNVTRQRAPTTSFTISALGREIYYVGLWKTHCGSKTRIRGGTSERDENKNPVEYACENTYGVSCGDNFFFFPFFYEREKRKLTVSPRVKSRSSAPRSVRVA